MKKFRDERLFRFKLIALIKIIVVPLDGMVFDHMVFEI